MATKQNGTKQKKGGSTAAAEAQASTPGTAEETTAPGAWPPGKYVLLVDKFTPSGLSTDSGITFQKGDTIEIERESEAQRLGRAGGIAPLDSIEARRAQATGDPDAERRIRAEELEAEARRLRIDSQSGNQDPDEE